VRIASLIVSLAFSLSLFGNTEVVNIEVEGLGTSERNAIDLALTEAMGRVNGRSIESEVLSQTSETTKSDNDSFEYLGSEEYQNEIKSKTKGVVESYNLISSGKDVTGLYRVKLSVSVIKFKPSKSANRKRIAVLPLQVRNNCCRVGSTSINGEALGPELTAAVSAYLVQTRKFTVLDRAYEGQASTERDRLAGANVPITELAKLGQSLVADYVLVGTINNIVLREQERKLSTVDRIVKSIQGNVAISYRIIDVPTGQVKFAETYNKRISGEIKSLEDAAQASLEAAQLTASNIGLKILEAIYPFVIESIDGDQVTIGTGGDVIQVGQQFRLIQYGEKVRDSYTKESLGRKESVIGMVEITEVTPKISYGKIINTSVKDLQSKFKPKSFIIRSVPEGAKKSNNIKKQKEMRKKIEEEFDEGW
tara:strand:- start:517 stop:1782 length:1266 start_codon:yes stop_codon:yes gene_type:complete